MQGWVLKSMEGIPGKGSLGLLAQRHNPMSAPFTPSALGDTQWEWWVSDVLLAALCVPPYYLG